MLVDPQTGRTLRHLHVQQALGEQSHVTGIIVAVTRDGRYAFLAWSFINKDGSNGPGYIEAWRLDQGGRSKLVPTGVDGLVVAARR